MYKANLNTDTVTRLSDRASIPKDPNNRDWVAYLKWVKEGGVTEAADSAPPPPTNDEMINTFFANPVSKALVDAIIDGSLPIATNLTDAEVKAKVKARMQ